MPPNAGMTRFLYGWQKIFTNKNIIYMFCLYSFSLKCIIKKIIYYCTVPLNNSVLHTQSDRVQHEQCQFWTGHIGPQLRQLPLVNITTWHLLRFLTYHSITSDCICEYYNIISNSTSMATVSYTVETHQLYKRYGKLCSVWIYFHYFDIKSPARGDFIFVFFVQWPGAMY